MWEMSFYHPSNILCMTEVKSSINLQKENSYNRFRDSNLDTIHTAHQFNLSVDHVENINHT
jgi:hypothetical protein